MFPLPTTQTELLGYMLIGFSVGLGVVWIGYWLLDNLEIRRKR